MTKRTIKLKLLTQTELVKVETSARTLAEFKKEVENLNIDWSSTKLIDRASKASFEIDSAVLPEIDSIMFVMPTKSKAGASYQQELRGKIKELKTNGYNIPFNYTTASNAVMEAFLESVENTNEEEVFDSEIILEPGVYKLTVKGSENVKINLIDETTEEDLDLEAEQIKRQL